MRVHRYLHIALACAFFGGLFGTNDLAYAYDSALQRSQFLANEPSYIKIIEAQMEERRASFMWRMRFESLNYNTDNNINSNTMGTSFRARMKYKLLENLDFKGRVWLNFRSGRTQALFGDQTPTSGLYPRELKLSWTPMSDYLTIDGGVIPQTWLNMPIFITSRGFPGLSQRFDLKNDTLGLSLTTQQLIPTSTTLSTRVAEKEEVPTFFTESAELYYNISSANWLRARFHWWSFKDLPHVVAYESAIYGNTLGSGGNQNNATFKYEFEGWITQLIFEQKLSNRLALQLQWNMLQNVRAPSDASDAQNIRAHVAYDSGRWIYSGSYDNFFIESDAAVSSYNSFNFGNTNRIGYALEAAAESKDWGVQFSLNYSNADLLNQNPPVVGGLQQDNLQTIWFKVETAYDFI
ncbi:MAG: hypothetical protein KDD33_04590 [Bdellovibrionales bacterium]|nr:hypothetical protein [Bdellovibrionales bacterium]